MKESKFQLTNGVKVSILFTVIGLFFYLLLANESELSEKAPDLIFSPGAFIATITIFNIIGWSIFKVNSFWNRKISTFHKGQSRIGWNLFLIAIVLLVLHFVIYILLRWFVGIEPIHGIQSKGLRFIFATWFMEMLIVGLLLTDLSTRHLLNLYKEKEELREVANLAQYRALQKQLNPHFLFNSLNTLISEIQYDPNNAILFTRKLSDVYRYVLQQEDKQLVSLQEELDFLSAYVFLHKVRLGNCLYIEKHLPDNLLSIKLPPLTLQLLIENVLKHNYMDEESPMKVVISTVSDSSALSVSNVLRPKQDSQPSGKGLHNLSERYRLLCNKMIEIQSSEQNFTVIIPLIYE